VPVAATEIADRSDAVELLDQRDEDVSQSFARGAIRCPFSAPLKFGVRRRCYLAISV